MPFLAPTVFFLPVPDTSAGDHVARAEVMAHIKTAVQEMPPASLDTLLDRISADYAGLSKQLKQIALHVERHRGLVGLEKIESLAARCGVQPSAVVRFAKHFGYTGYRELQKVLHQGITRQVVVHTDYEERIQQVIDRQQGALRSADITQEFVGGAIAGLYDLRRDLNASALHDAVELLANAPVIWVIGARRSFPVAVYLAYALEHTEKTVHLVSGIGSMTEGQMRSLRAEDIVIAISFQPYSDETVSAVKLAKSRGAQLIALTDSRMSPIAKCAKATFLVRESTTFGFRALTNTTVLAQSLFVALAYRLKLNEGPIASAIFSFNKKDVF
jgi:DNA-binding MurR/RpiR family transcriptional regulator